MIDIVDRTYQFLQRLFDGQAGGESSLGWLNTIRCHGTHHDRSRRLIIDRDRARSPLVQICAFLNEREHAGVTAIVTTALVVGTVMGFTALRLSLDQRNNGPSRSRSLCGAAV
jgi:hypothetical protein